MTYEYRALKALGVTGWFQSGTLRIINDRIYLCEWPLVEMFRQFDGKDIEVALAPVEAKYEMDPKIRPLVERLQALGCKTVSSCQGHIGTDRKPYPWVALVRTDPHLIVPSGHGWCIEYGSDPDLVTWRTEAEASTEAELEALQDSIARLIEAL